MVKTAWGVVAVIAALSLLTGGCMAGLGGGDYSRSQTRTEQTVRMGTVTAVSEVTIEGTEGAVGAVAGGATGAVIGHQVGKGGGKTVATVLGALGGAAAGAAVEKGVTKRPGWEITVKLDEGQTIAVVQEKEQNETFAVGDKVRVLKSSDGTTRVRK